MKIYLFPRQKSSLIIAVYRLTEGAQITHGVNSDSHFSETRQPKYGYPSPVKDPLLIPVDSDWLKVILPLLGIKFVDVS